MQLLYGKSLDRILWGFQQSLSCVYQTKECYFSNQHHFFSNFMKSANCFFQIFSKKLAEREGRASSVARGKTGTQGRTGKEKGENKGKRHTKNSRKWRNRLNLSTMESSGQCQTLQGKKKWEGRKGRSLRSKNGSWSWCPANFFWKILKKRFALFEKIEKKWCWFEK